MKQPYQAGLAVAASHLLAHHPGDCPHCRAPHLSPETRSLLTLLAAQEKGKWGILWHALLLGLRSGVISWATL